MKTGGHWDAGAPVYKISEFNPSFFLARIPLARSIFNIFIMKNSSDWLRG